MPIRRKPALAGARHPLPARSTSALSYEHEVYPYDRSGNSEGASGFAEDFIVPGYTLTDQVHLLGAFMDPFSVLHSQLQEIDFRDTATEFEVPRFFVQCVGRQRVIRDGGDGGGAGPAPDHPSA